MSQQPISIVGAGIGGVTLGRCLKQRGISAVLYEKASSSPRNLYGVTLHASTYKPLLDLLEIDEATFRRQVAVDGASGGNGAIHGQQSAFRAHRQRLESLIREGLDIRWEHAVDKVEQTSSGTVLHVKDGEKVEQKCSVATDGVHSAIRRCLLPDAEPKVLPFVAINGKRRVKKADFEKLYSPMMKGSNVAEVLVNGALLNVSINDVGDLISTSWTYSRAVRGSSDALYTPHRPNAGATDIPDEFYAEVSALGQLEQPFAEVFDVEKIKNDRTLTWLMRTTESGLSGLEKLAENGVLFIGDSVHAEAILGGNGYNNAVLDAINLAEHIASRGSLSNWYHARYPGWQESLERSKSKIQAMHRERHSVL